MDSNFKVKSRCSLRSLIPMPLLHLLYGEEKHP